MQIQLQNFAGETWPEIPSTTLQTEAAPGEGEWEKAREGGKRRGCLKSYYVGCHNKDIMKVFTEKL